MSEDKKKEVHPIVKKALEKAYQGFDSVKFDDYAIEELQEMLKQLFGKPELLKAVVDLINLARVLDEQGSHSASMKLMVVVSTAGDALKALREKT
ncbi:MAG: hypothetical protein ACTSR7_15930 [Promethearchaeota archaeon]